MKTTHTVRVLLVICIIAASCKKEADSPFRNATLFFLGDSNFKGYLLPDTTKRLTTLLSAKLGAIENNQAVSGITLQDGIPKAPAGSYMDRLTILPKCNRHGNSYIILMIGTNDVRIAAAYTPPLYSAALNVLLDTLMIDNGFTPSRILLSTPPVLTSYGNGSCEKLLQYNDTIQAVALRRGCRFVNLYDSLCSHRNETLLCNDGFHLSELGHHRSADIFFSSLQ